MRLSFTLPTLFVAFVFSGKCDVLADAGTDFEAGRQAGIQAVLDDPGAFGLYTEESIMDLNLGGVIVKSGGGGFEVDFKVEKSNDLLTWEVWESFVRFLPDEDGKTFLRLRAVPLMLPTDPGGPPPTEDPGGPPLPPDTGPPTDLPPPPSSP